MAKVTTGYQATQTSWVTLDCVCENCGQPFSYKTKVVGYGETQDWGFGASKANAATKASSSLNAQLAMMLKGNFQNADVHYCPHCQALQSWMLKKVKTEKANKITNPIAMVLMGIVAILVLIGFNNAEVWKFVGLTLGVLLVVSLLISLMVNVLWTPKGYHKGQAQRMPTVRME